MLELNKSYSLIGYGVSNMAVCKHLIKKGIFPIVRCKNECELPSGIKGIFGDSYLNTNEDIVFRSPSVRPDLIKGGGTVYTEVGYGLKSAKSFKIGVTGSDGKTTTSTLIYRMLCQGNKNAFLGGNIGKPIISFAPNLSKDDYLVTELSSFQLMDFCEKLDIAVITNISQNHLDWHKNMEEYILAKKQILKNASLSVLNYDDTVLRDLGKENTIYFSLFDQRENVNKNIKIVHIVNGTIYYCHEELFKVSDICLKGRFNVQNVLSAIACTYHIVGKEPCHTVAKQFCGVDNRMENVGVVLERTFINSSIDSTPNRSLNTLSAFPCERVIAIMGGYDKNLSYECLGPTLDKLKAIVLCGENREKIANVTHGKIINVSTLNEAVKAAFKLSAQGDYIILSPASCSFDMFKNYKERAKCFKEAVKEIENGKY